MGEINPISSKNPFKPFIYAVVLAAGIFLGYIISLNAGAKTHFGANTTGDKWETILKFVQQKYVDTLNVAELEEKAINEMNCARI